MKSVTVRSPEGILLLKVLHRKNGRFEATRIGEWKDLIVEIRDDQGCKVWMDGTKEERVKI